MRLPTKIIPDIPTGYRLLAEGEVTLPSDKIWTWNRGPWLELQECLDPKITTPLVEEWSNEDEKWKKLSLEEIKSGSHLEIIGIPYQNSIWAIIRKK